MVKMITQSHGTKEPAALIASCPLMGSKKCPSARALAMDAVWYKYLSIYSMHSQEQSLPPGAIPGFDSYGFSHPLD